MNLLYNSSLSIAQVMIKSNLKLIICGPIVIQVLNQTGLCLKSILMKLNLKGIQESMAYLLSNKIYQRKDSQENKA